MHRNPKNVCACLAVRKTARAITQFYDSYIQPFGLKPTQHSLLLAVYIADGVTISGLAHFMVMDRTTLTRNLKPLEKEGLLTVKLCDRSCCLTYGKTCTDVFRIAVHADY